MRLFIAIELDDRIKDELCFIQKRLKMQGMKGNYTPRENLHLTESVKRRINIPT